jgi:hypothetical protein
MPSTSLLQLATSLKSFPGALRPKGLKWSESTLGSHLAPGLTLNKGLDLLEGLCVKLISVLRCQLRITRCSAKKHIVEVDADSPNGRKATDARRACFCLILALSQPTDSSNAGKRDLTQIQTLTFGLKPLPKTIGDGQGLFQ